ncbi:D-amino acid dehydrogenase [Paracandidimonas soli]|uniref:D-amino-acid dehydrogenase n=1 Tax=Paracandidimonas soli TaxID=1917182 RepID=A0A4V2VSL2_9BURK|nr:D-amino acid dehydrogenase [Paracandidimonas soli]TCV02590.1 D-amino-acid dehydrogenase [Paracandidimonas soli]
MKVIVLGAGIVGMCSAYALQQAGMDVVVVDRQDGPARETSRGNAGGLCPGFAGPWAAPGMMGKALRWLFEEHAPLKWKPRASMDQLTWLASFARNCTKARFARNKSTMQRIAQYSSVCLKDLRENTGIVHDFNQGGVLQVFQTEEELALARQSSQVLSRFGVAHALVDAQRVLELEPALRSASATFTGGLHLMEDATGDSHLLAQGLEQWLRERGVEFHFGTRVDALAPGKPGQDCAVRLADGRSLAADAVVVATGSDAPQLLRPLGIRLPVYPVKGYAITMEIADDEAAPRSCVMDEHSKIMVTRLGTRLRAAGIAEISDHKAWADPAKTGFVRDTVQRLFPGAGDYSTAEGWCGLRPMTPDGPGYLGATPHKGIFLACGQGSNGWTQAAGVGRIVADIVAGRTPGIDMRGLTLENRYG